MTGLEFMGKDWDRFAPQATTARTQRSKAGGVQDDKGQPWNKARRGTAGVRTTFKCRTCGGWSGSFSEARSQRQRQCTCDQPDLDYSGAPPTLLAYQAWCEQWATDALRVLRPGGWLLAFGGTRTWHRLACGIEDAGFEMRDTIAEFGPTYGPLAWVTGQGFPKGKACLKPAWEPVIVARRPGSSVLQIDASRIGNPDGHGGGSKASSDYSGIGGYQGGFVEAPEGRWPPNVALIHSAGCQPTGTRKIRGSGSVTGQEPSAKTLAAYGEFQERAPFTAYADADGMEEVTAWTCQPDCPVALLDQQSGITKASGSAGRPFAVDTPGWNRPAHSGYRGTPDTGLHDQGGASRFMYTAKAGPNERVTIDGEGHPTQKPLALMRWLVRLVTPLGGTVLDMFAGSGTTGEAAMLEGFRCVLIDKDPTNLPSIRVRTHPYVRRTKVVTNGQQTGPEQGSLL